MDKIPQEVTRIPSSKIPTGVAEIGGSEDKEALPFYVSYEFYRDNACEINSLQANQAKKALIDLRKIGDLSSIGDFNPQGIKTDPVFPIGDYKRLFSTRMPIDIEMKEHKLQSTARIFYFVIDRVFYCVAITHRHLETEKVRRG